MAKPVTLTGKTELLAAIYNEDHLPSAIVVSPGRNNPYCLHSLREGDESLFLQLLEQSCNGADIEFKPENYEQAQFQLFKFFEDYPHQNHTCIGCRALEQQGKGGAHNIRDSEQASIKLCEDCA